MREPRVLLPWETGVGCPHCHVEPGQRCVTVETRYPPNWAFLNRATLIGSPTVAHKDRVTAWVQGSRAAADWGEAT